jgi:Rac GTPase-activating protein 1
MPMPCVPMAQTPSSKGSVGTVVDYTPNTSRMIPALVIHCINEIKRRGINEVGIYRLRDRWVFSCCLFGFSPLLLLEAQ